MGKREIYNIKSIKAKKYRVLDLGKYNEWFGDVEGRFNGMFYGESGSGKSVAALQFAQFYANNIGKVLYNSHEEGVRKTIQDRVLDFEIEADKLWIADAMPFERMMYKITRNYYRLVVIDSIQYMEFTFDQLQEMRETFAKRHLSILMVSFGKKNNPDKAKEHLHACDVKCFFSNGKVLSYGRYLSKPVTKQLFVPTGTVNHPTLF